MNPKLKAVSVALDNAVAARVAVERHTALSGELETREAALLDTVDLNDEKGFAEISRVRLTLEILPKKIAALEVKLAAANDALRSAILAAIADVLCPLASKKEEALRASIRKSVAPLLADGVNIDHQVEQIFQSNATAGRIGRCSMSYEYSVNEMPNPEASARKLLDNVATLEAITIS